MSRIGSKQKAEPCIRWVSTQIVSLVHKSLFCACVSVSRVSVSADGLLRASGCLLVGTHSQSSQRMAIECSWEGVHEDAFHAHSRTAASKPPNGIRFLDAAAQARVGGWRAEPGAFSTRQRVNRAAYLAEYDAVSFHWAWESHIWANHGGKIWCNYPREGRVRAVRLSGCANLREGVLWPRMRYQMC